MLSSDRNPYALVLSHVVVDEIWAPSATQPVEVLGGAGVHAAVGQALAFEGAGTSVLVSGVGDDFPVVAREQMTSAGIDHAGLVAVHESTPRTVITYTTETDRTERPAFGMDHFTRCDPSLQMVPPTRRDPDAVYIFAGVTEPAWQVVENASRTHSVVWELDVSICDPEFSDEIRARSPQVELVSLNEQELAGLVGGATLPDLRRAMDELFPSVAAVALRRGENGAVFATADGVWSARPNRDVLAVDPTGAGNAFSGALAIAWLRTHRDPAQTLAASMAAAAITVGRNGPALPIDAATRSDFANLTRNQKVDVLTWK